MKLVRFVSVVVLLAAVGLWPGFVGAQPPGQAGTVPPGIIVKPPGESELQVSINVGQAVYREEKEVEAGGYIRFTLNKQAVVYLLLIKSDGEVRLLFPNKFVQANFLLPGTYTFPGRGLLESPFEIPGPEGIAYVQTIATPVSIGLEPQAFTEEFPLLGRAPEAVKTWIERLIAGKQLRPAEWTAAWTHYEVIKKTTPFAEPPTGDLTVTVIDKEKRQPLADAKVSVAGRPGLVWTDVRGEAQVLFLPPGDHQVSVERNGYKPAMKPVRIGSGQQSTESFELDPEPRRAVLKAPAKAFVAEIIRFDARESSGPIILYEWVFDGNCTGDVCTIQKRTRQPFVDHAYDKAGVYKPIVIVVFEDGTTARGELPSPGRITITPRPEVPGAPGSTVLTRTPISPANPTPIVNPITMSLISGGAKFIAANTSYQDHLQHANVVVQAGQQATLFFDYQIEALPDRIGPGSGVEIQSFVLVRFFDSAGQELAQGQAFTVNTKGAAGLCQASGTGGSQRPPVRQWLFCQQPLTVPQNTAVVVIEVGLDIPKNPSGKPVTIAYKNLDLK